jgi:hypothetical protein
MGLGIFGSSYSIYDKSPTNTTLIERIIEKPVYKSLPNPDPYNWIINKSYKEGRFLLIDITYPDCTNYEGRKIMLYEDATLVGLKRQKILDPHFSSNKKFHSPVARFEPTEYGWQMAQGLIKILKGENE